MRMHPVPIITTRLRAGVVVGLTAFVLSLALVLSGAHALTGRTQTADQLRQVQEHGPGQTFDYAELTPEQQRNLADAERVVDAAVERLYASFDLDSVWADYFDPMAALADMDLAYLAPDFEGETPELLRRKQIIEVNYFAAWFAFLVSHLRMEDLKQFFDKPELFLRSLSPDVRKALKYGNTEQPPTLKNKPELEAFLSSLGKATAVLRHEIPVRWTEQSPAWVTLKTIREDQSQQDSRFRPYMSLDDTGAETYVVVRDGWWVELRLRDGHMRITLFCPLSE